MNSKCLTTYKGDIVYKEISPSEVDEVINMKDVVYIKDKEGLRILANDPARQ